MNLILDLPPPYGALDGLGPLVHLVLIVGEEQQRGVFVGHLQGEGGGGGGGGGGERGRGRERGGGGEGRVSKVIKSSVEYSHNIINSQLRTLKRGDTVGTRWSAGTTWTLELSRGRAHRHSYVLCEAGSKTCI